MKLKLVLEDGTHYSFNNQHALLDFMKSEFNHTWEKCFTQEMVSYMESKLQRYLDIDPHDRTSADWRDGAVLREVLEELKRYGE